MCVSKTVSDVLLLHLRNAFLALTERCVCKYSQKVQESLSLNLMPLSDVTPTVGGLAFNGDGPLFRVWGSRGVLCGAGCY